MSDYLWPHELQHARLPCPSLSPGVCSSSCPLIQWCYLATSSSVTPFSSCPQSLPTSGSFPISQLFASGSQSIGASVLVHPMNMQGWFPLGLTGLISLQSKGLSRIFSSTTVQKHQFFSAKPSLGDDYSWQEIWVNHAVSEYVPISHNLQGLWWAYFLKSSFT